MKNVGNSSDGRSQGVPKFSGHPCIGRMGALRGHLCDSTAFLLYFYRAMHFSAKRGLAIACRPSVRPSVRRSVTLVDCDHIGWKSWKLTARTISPTPSLFATKRRSTYSQGKMGNFGEYRGEVGKKWHAGEQKRQYLRNA